MKTTTVADPLDSALLSLDGRRFPIAEEDTDKPSSQLVRVLPSTPVDLQLARRMFESLRPTLAWFTEPRPESRGDANRIYSASLAKIRACQEDINRLLAATCESSVLYRAYQGSDRTEPYPTASRETYAAEIRDLIAEATIRWSPQNPVSDARMMSRDVQELVSLLEDSTNVELLKFVTELQQGLARLVDSQICGLLEWLPNSCCRYHYFRKAIAQRPGYFRRSELSSGADSHEDDPPSWEDRVRRSRPDVFEVPYDVRVIRYEHELINAIRTGLGNTRVVIPEKIRTVISAIPEWLYPFVEIVDGTLTRQRVIEQVIRSGSTEVALPIVRVQSWNAADPGLVIGSFLLCGWGPEEIAAEESRQRWLRQQNPPTELPQRTAMRVLTSLLSILLLYLIREAYRGNVSSVFLTATVVLTAGSLWQTVQLQILHSCSQCPGAAAQAFATGGSFLFLSLMTAVFQVPGTAFQHSKLLLTLAVVSLLVGLVHLRKKSTQDRDERNET